jgi:cyclic pyranopterin monophosphate synthase
VRFHVKTLPTDRPDAAAFALRPVYDPRHVVDEIELAQRVVVRLGCQQGERMTDLSHVDESGDVHMVDVGAKPLSRRRATAQARVSMAPATAQALRGLPKGDALVTAQLAGIMAAKRTAELIPLCHPLPLTHVDVRLEVENSAVAIETSVETTAATGVEMEALVAASVAALTIYDMAKAIDKEMEIGEVRLVAKTKEPA